MNKHDDVFGKFYEQALPFAGPGSVIDAIRERGAIWYQRTTDRALVMTGITQYRIVTPRTAFEISSKVKAGHLVKAACPLDDVTDIYVVTERA